MHQILPGRMLLHRDPRAALDVHQVGVMGHGGKEVLAYSARGGVWVEALEIRGRMVGVRFYENLTARSRELSDNRIQISPQTITLQMLAPFVPCL